MNINDLLIEFDEMGYCPTTLCENPNEQAIKWKNNLIIEIEKLNLKIAKLEDMIEQDKLVEKGEGRFQRLKRTHPKQYEYCMNGGEYNEQGIWQPNEKGLGMKHCIDVINSIYGKDFIKY